MSAEESHLAAVEDQPADPLSALLSAYDRGRLDRRGGEKLQQLVSAVIANGKKGSLTLKVEVKPAGKNAGHQLLVAGDVESKPPKPEPAERFFFADRAMNLSQNDPNQTRLPVDEGSK